MSIINRLRGKSRLKVEPVLQFFSFTPQLWREISAPKEMALHRKRLAAKRWMRDNNIKSKR